MTPWTVTHQFYVCFSGSCSFISFLVFLVLLEQFLKILSWFNFSVFEYISSYSFVVFFSGCSGYYNINMWHHSPLVSTWYFVLTMELEFHVHPDLFTFSFVKLHWLEYQVMLIFLFQLSNLLYKPIIQPTYSEPKIVHCTYTFLLFL